MSEPTNHPGDTNPTTRSATPGVDPRPAEAAPAWRPPTSEHGRTASILFGVVVLAIGLWFFAETTLGLDLHGSAGARPGPSS